MMYFRPNKIVFLLGRPISFEFKSCNWLLRIRATNKKWCWPFFFFSDSRSSVAPRSSGCRRTARLSCQKREVQVFGWSNGQMESVTAYSKHLVWLIFPFSPLSPTDCFHPGPLTPSKSGCRPFFFFSFWKLFYCSPAAASSLFLSSRPWPTRPGGEARGWFAAKADTRRIGGHVNRTLKIHRGRDYF